MKEYNVKNIYHKVLSSINKTTTNILVTCCGTIFQLLKVMTGLFLANYREVEGLTHNRKIINNKKTDLTNMK